MKRLDEDNGLLPRMTGDLIAAALAKMPPAETATEKTGSAEVDVPQLGRVVVTCVLRRDPRWRRKFWSAVRADLVK